MISSELNDSSEYESAITSGVDFVLEAIEKGELVSNNISEEDLSPSELRDLLKPLKDPLSVEMTSGTPNYWKIRDVENCTYEIMSGEVNVHSSENEEIGKRTSYEITRYSAQDETDVTGSATIYITNYDKETFIRVSAWTSDPRNEDRIKTNAFTKGRDKFEEAIYADQLLDSGVNTLSGVQGPPHPMLDSRSIELREDFERKMSEPRGLYAEAKKHSAAYTEYVEIAKSSQDELVYQAYLKAAREEYDQAESLLKQRDEVINRNYEKYRQEYLPRKQYETIDSIRNPEINKN